MSSSHCFVLFPPFWLLPFPVSSALDFGNPFVGFVHHLAHRLLDEFYDVYDLSADSHKPGLVLVRPTLAFL